MFWVLQLELVSFIYVYVDINLKLHKALEQWNELFLLFLFDCYSMTKNGIIFATYTLTQTSVESIHL